MKKILLLTFLVLFMASKFIYAEENNDALVSDIEDKVVEITSNFNGSELFIFGSREMNDNITEGIKSGIIIEVIATAKTRKIRKKERKFGIWVNDDEKVLEGVPDFYYINSSENIEELLSEDEINNNDIGIINHLAKNNNDVNSDFINALIRIKKRKNLYQFKEGELEFKNDILFSTKVTLPNNIGEGFYVIKTHLTDGTNVTSVDKQLLVVKKIGLGNFLFEMAHKTPLIYGIFSILVALFAGWAASETFRRLRG
ncbi:MAG: hypothetical protein CML38_00460 [Rhodobacteraceae bacterium]|nr:MAG: hypothetical protein CML38_00460 [Paracoccaceae bacterium]